MLAAEPPRRLLTRQVRKPAGCTALSCQHDNRLSADVVSGLDPSSNTRQVASPINLKSETPQPTRISGCGFFIPEGWTMQTARIYRKALLAAALAATLSCPPMRAHAASKEMIQLQTQVQQLLDMVQRLQSTMDTRFAVLQNLAPQTADHATQMSSTVTTLQQKLNAQNESLSGKLDSNAGQVQSLNDSVDELKTHISKL